MIDPMPDDYYLLVPRPDPERIDLGRIQTDLEFGSNRLSALDPAGVGPATAPRNHR